MAEVRVELGTVEGLTFVAIVDDSRDRLVRLEVEGSGRTDVRIIVTGQFSFTRDIAASGGDTLTVQSNRYKIRTDEASWSPIAGYGVSFESL